MKTSQVAIAASAYAQGNYAAALEIYTRLGQQLGEALFQANIRLCHRRWKEKLACLRRNLSINHNESVIGTFYASSPYEELDLLLDVCTELVRKGEKFKLLLLGNSDPIIGSSSEDAANAGLREPPPWLIQVGRVPPDQVADYYALLDVFVILSTTLPLCQLVHTSKDIEALVYGKRLVVSDVVPLAECAQKKEEVLIFETGNATSLATALQRSLDQPATQPNTGLKLQYAADILAMVKEGEEQKGGESAPLEEAVAVHAKSASTEASDPVTEPKSGTNGIEVLPEEVRWENYNLSDGEVLALSGELIGEGVKGRKAVILVEVKGTSGSALDLSAYGYLWSDVFNHWFKYLYPNETKGVFFEFKSNENEVTVSFALLKYGCRAGEKVFLKNKKVTITKINGVEHLLRQFLERSPSLLDVECLLYADITLNVIDGSSIWLSSMAKILATQQKTILLIKENVRNFQIFDSLRFVNNLIILQPSDFMDDNIALDVKQSILCLRVLDNYIPTIKNVVVRGLSAALELHSTRQFKHRTFVYLTDFYSYENNKLTITHDQEQAIRQIARQAHGFIAQTPEIERKLKDLSSFEIKTTLIPPPIPKINFKSPKPLNGGEINIVYAGKITPTWGVLELLDWTEKLRLKGHQIKLTVIANKISSIGAQRSAFRGLINKRFKELDVNYIQGLPREDVLDYFTRADFVWCYRPKELEESVLELSTKLVEAVACGARAINYPSKIHMRLLGKDYPFFVSSFEDLEALIVNVKNLDSFDTSVLAKKVIKDHSMTTAAEKIGKFINSGGEFDGEKIVFAGHDRKFIDAYYSYLKSKGAKVRFDEWEWGSPRDEKRSMQFLLWADKIFCEWGLANAVWYSSHNTDGKPLFVRIHLQEINPRAKKFGNKIEQANVAKFIVVSERVGQEAEKMFGWEKDKIVHVPNFVFDDEFVIPKERFIKKKEKIVLGMVGIVPQRKRFDRAIDLLLALRKKGYDVELAIKGPGPEEYDFMHSPSRSPELEYYKDCYYKIDRDPLLNGRVSFTPWGNDMPIWYEGIDCILSPSDFESFHYAVAEGVLSGCHPIIWPWEESDRIYSREWCVNSVAEAVSSVDEFYNLDKEFLKEKIGEKRALVCERYGFHKVAKRLNDLLFSCARIVIM